MRRVSYLVRKPLKAIWGVKIQLIEKIALIYEEIDRIMEKRRLNYDKGFICEILQSIEENCTV